jgi:hypothetical protein
MTVNSVPFQLYRNERSLVDRANNAKPGQISRKDVLKIQSDLKTAIYNCEGTGSWFCPSTKDVKVKAYASKAIQPLRLALTKLEREHNLGGSSVTKTALATAAAAASILAYNGLGNVPTFLAGAFNAAQTAVTGGLSGLAAGLVAIVPVSNLLIGAGTVGLALIAASKIKDYFNNEEQE